MKSGDLVVIACEGDTFSDNYIKFLLNTIGEAPKPIGVIIGTYAKAAEEKLEAVTFYRVLVNGKEHLIDENSLKLVCES